MKKRLSLLLLLLSTYSIYAQKSNYRLLIGSYTTPSHGEGIYSFELDLKKASIVQKSVFKEISNPSFLTISPDKKKVYAVNESSASSSANAFHLDAKTGKLTLINASATKGDGPCFISLTKKHLFTANYGGGSISIFARKSDGSLTEIQQLIQQKGSSIHPSRQNKSHVHQTILTPDGKFLLANNLGTDKIIVYKYNPTSKFNILIPHDSISLKPGSGPRHLTFSKDGKIVYLLQELDGTVSVLKINKGYLSLIQESSIVKEDGIETSAADIHLSPDGKFLYTTNRGTANNISCFLVKKDGTIEYKYQTPTSGLTPRNFAITPDGNYLLVAHQKSDNVVIFKRNKTTGTLTDSGMRIEVGSPVCLVFY